jgi:hypothetical protein
VVLRPSAEEPLLSNDPFLELRPSVELFRAATRWRGTPPPLPPPEFTSSRSRLNLREMKIYFDHVLWSRFYFFVCGGGYCDVTLYVYCDFIIIAGGFEFFWR